MADELVSKIRLQPRGLPLIEFNSLDELAVWADAQHQAWSSINGPKSAHRRAFRLSQSALENTISTFDLLRSAAAAGNAASVDSLVTSRQDLLVPTDSLPGRLIVDVGERDPEVARMMLLLQRAEMGQPLDFVNSPPPWEVLISAQMRLSSIYAGDEYNRAVVSSFSTIAQEWNSKFSELRDQQDLITSLFSATAAQTISTVEAISGQAQAELKNSSDTLLGTLATRSSDKLSELQGLIAAFNEQLRLQAPATYWAAKAASHKTARRNLRIALVFTILAFIASTAAALKWLNQYFLTNAVHSLLLVSPAILVALWSARLVFRGYNRNNDLLHDAELRSVLATTYLALTKEGAAAANEAERLLILQALVRPEAISPEDVSAGSLLELAKVAAQSPHR